MKTATIQTNKGTIKLELYDDKVPKTVENFETLAKKGFYDGLSARYRHRRAWVQVQRRVSQGPKARRPGRPLDG
jgi:peptidyl-prolyl cis-trans isomerase B (cyclophilin B)